MDSEDEPEDMFDSIILAEKLGEKRVGRGDISDHVGRKS